MFGKEAGEILSLFFICPVIAADLLENTVKKGVDFCLPMHYIKFSNPLI